MNRPNYPSYKNKVLPSIKSERLNLLEKSKDLPQRYLANDLKEELAVEYVKNFEKKYHDFYPDKPPVYLYPLNEYKVEKIISTTLKPTQPPYRELYNLVDCSNFVADYFVYEELENPVRYPVALPSPELLFKWRRGDSFDLCVVLTSLLLGNGYDAYCVCGYAPRFITQRDLSKQICPYLQNNIVDNIEVVHDNNEDDPYEIPLPRYEGSIFIKKKDEEEQKKLEEQRKYENEESDEELPGEPNDIYNKKRLHCWVMVQAGKRKMDKHVFIEPSTSAIYPVDSSPYHGIYFVYNSNNIWVNVQPTDDDISYTNLDLRNKQNWENVFHEPDLGVVRTELSNYGELIDDGSKKKMSFIQDKYLDLPGFWSNPVVIDNDSYEKHFADGPGESVSLYLRAKVERYGFLVNEQGLTKRITLYRDLARIYPVKIIEEFKFRRDKLNRREINSKTGSFVEHYDPGKSDQEKQISVIPGKQIEVIYYSGSKLDYLKRRVEIIGQKIIEEFESHPIGIYYRSFRYDNSLSGENHLYTIRLDDNKVVPLMKLTLKYNKAGIKPSEEISKITYFYLPKEDERIEIKYHFEPGRITYKTITLYRDERPPICHDINPDFVRPTDMIIKLLMKEMVEREKFNLGEINKVKQETVIKTKALATSGKGADKRGSVPVPVEDSDSMIEKDIFVKAREKKLSQVLKDTSADEIIEDEAEKDYLYPFLHGRDVTSIDKKVAQEIFNECTQSLKNRLYDRAGIIQRRLEEENAALAKKQAAFQRNRDHIEGAEEEYEEYCQEAMFRIKILEQRLQRHLEQSRVKYTELNQKLKNDQRLIALNV